MCGIFMSKDEAEFNRLKELQLSTGRGLTCTVTKIHDFFIGHCRTPTSNSSQDHPSKIDDTMLWHNGLLKQTYLKSLGKLGEWDTKVLHNIILHDGFDALGTVNGSFACVFVNWFGDILFFRNDNAPLFINLETISLSSTPVEGFVSLEPNVVFSVMTYGTTIGRKSTFNSTCSIVYQ